LVFAGLARRDRRTRDCHGERDIERAACGEHATARQTIEASTISLTVEDGLAQSPAGKTQQSEREQPQQDAAERTAKQVLQGIARALRVNGEAARSQRRSQIVGSAAISRRIIGSVRLLTTPR
jgi:hypothetical protein